MSAKQWPDREQLTPTVCLDSPVLSVFIHTCLRWSVGNVLRPRLVYPASNQNFSKRPHNIKPSTNILDRNSNSTTYSRTKLYIYIYTHTQLKGGINEFNWIKTVPLFFPKKLKKSEGPLGLRSSSLVALILLFWARQAA